MSLSPSTFETIVPSRYITFTLPDNLRVAVLDSPSSTTTAAAAVSVAAIHVPEGRESDWIFSTFSGHLQLLISSSSQTPLSRLILFGKNPSHSHPTSFDSSSSEHQLDESNIAPLLSALTPKSDTVPQVPIWVYEDDVVRSSVLEICEGPRVGEMLIENVELEEDSGVREFRRRLRFKRMPNFVQTQIRIVPLGKGSEGFDCVEWELDIGVLVHPYLGPMVAGVSVISEFLAGRTRDGVRPRALCLGVGGGAMVGFLSVRLDFRVVGVEEDEVVLDVGKRYFGLGGDVGSHESSIQLFVGDGIKYVEDLASEGGGRFDVVMVDLDSSDAAMGVCAPPVEFVRNSVIVATRAVLCDEGVVVVNTIPSGKSFYARLVGEFHEVFEELYEIDVGNGENFVLIAAVKSRIENASGGAIAKTEDDAFLKKLKSVVPTSYIGSIRKISKTAAAAAAGGYPL